MFSKRAFISYAILQSLTGPEQGFPCVVFPHREKHVFIAGFPVDENRFFSVGNTTQGWVCSVERYIVIKIDVLDRLNTLEMKFF